MKKTIIALFCVCCGLFSFSASAQKFALVDLEYILKNIPAYEMANEQLNQVSQRWQKEVEEITRTAETMYKNYQAEMVFLTDEQKKAREAEIVAKEKEAVELRNKYFGPEGELYKKRQSLMKPIQEDVYNAVKKISEERGYQAIFDRASSSDLIFASPKIDVSNEVLDRLGYSN
ncbi:MAG: OmpH family outer membrane protein [Muribaculaceae bacterium]|nr:OmpH family outer membrane protein [Muribaculaceae bacterium]